MGHTIIIFPFCRIQKIVLNLLLFDNNKKVI